MVQENIQTLNNITKKIMANKKIKHNYQSIEGWFNMETQYLELLNHCPEGGTFVELGCFKGKSTSFIVTEIINQGRKVNFTTIDSFEGHTNSTDSNEVQAYKGITNIEKDFILNMGKLLKHCQYKKCLSHDGAQYFADGSVDILFIDAGHSKEAVMRDIESWLPKMKPNGIIAGHDYTAWAGVKKAVDEKFGNPHKIENDCWFIYLEAKF
jgi:predicted O-methyltransferase YrrM